MSDNIVFSRIIFSSRISASLINFVGTDQLCPSVDPTCLNDNGKLNLLNAAPMPSISQ